MNRQVLIVNLYNTDSHLLLTHYYNIEEVHQQHREREKSASVAAHKFARDHRNRKLVN